MAYGRSTVITPRYELPALLCLPALWLALTAYLGRVDSWRGRYLHPRQAVLIAVLVLTHHLATSLGDRSRADPAALPSAIATNIATTQSFAETLDSVVRQSRSDPSRPIILDAQGGIAYEPVGSVVRFLRHADVASPIAIRLQRLDSDAGNAFVGLLADALERIQDAGLEARGEDPYRLLTTMLRILKGGARPGNLRIIPLPQLDDQARATAIVWRVN